MSEDFSFFLLLYKLNVASYDSSSKIFAIIIEGRMFQLKKIHEMYEISFELSKFLQF